MTITLKPLTIEDYDIYNKYCQLANYESYQTNFHSLYLWNSIYKTEFYYNEHFLITRSFYNDFYFWNVPLCKKEYFKEAIDTILEFCDEHQLPFLLDAVLNTQEQWLEELYPNTFIFSHSLDSQCYIYDANMNRTLSGKKMQKRRNHFNAFMKEYSNRYVFRDVTKEDKAEIVALINQWSSHKDTSDKAIFYEKIGILNVIDHLNELDYKMSCIEIDGKIEAFILGSYINENTVQIHSEKANTEIRGLYVAVFKFFLEEKFNDVLFVNREEDLGIESLRKAKKQLHPIKMLDQAFAYKNDISIRKANSNDDTQLKNLWLESFEEDDEKFYINYRKNAKLEIYVLEINHRIASCVYLRHLDLSNQQQAFYIEGVSTYHLYRHRGYMKELLNYSMSLYPDAVFFIQAYQWEIYDSFNFDGHIYKQLIITDQKIEINQIYGIKNGVDKDLFSKLYEQYSKKYDICIKRKLPIDIDGYLSIYTNDAYCLYAKFNDIYVVTEIIYTNIEAAYTLINHLIEQYQTIKIICEPDFLIGEKLLFAKYTSNKLSTNNILFNEYI